MKTFKNILITYRLLFIVCVIAAVCVYLLFSRYAGNKKYTDNPETDILIQNEIAALENLLPKKEIQKIKQNIRKYCHDNNIKDDAYPFNRLIILLQYYRQNQLYQYPVFNGDVVRQTNLFMEKIYHNVKEGKLGQIPIQDDELKRLCFDYSEFQRQPAFSPYFRLPLQPEQEKQINDFIRQRLDKIDEKQQQTLMNSTDLPEQDRIILWKAFIKELTSELVFKPIIEQTNKKVSKLYSQRFGSLSQPLPRNGSDMDKEKDSEKIATDADFMETETDNIFEFIDRQIKKACNDAERQAFLLQHVQLLQKNFEYQQFSPQLIQETKLRWKQGIENLPKQNDNFDYADCMFGFLWQTYHILRSERQPLSDLEREEKTLQLQQLLQVLDEMIPAMNRQNKLPDETIQGMSNEINRCKARLHTYCDSPFYPLLYYPLPQESFDNAMITIQKRLDEEIEKFWKNIDQYTQSQREDALRQVKSGNKNGIDFFQNRINMQILLQSQLLVALTMGNIVRQYGFLNRNLNYKNTEFFLFPNIRGVGLAYRMQEGIHIKLKIKEVE
jgi:hypothetical protein